jgi:hypothetical protein
MPFRFFGLRPSSRAFLTISGEGAEASVAALAGFDSAAGLAGVDGGVADEGAAGDAGALGVDGAGVWAREGAAAATTISDAKRRMR